MRSFDLQNAVQFIKKHLNYEFRDPKKLSEALAHPSAGGKNNQRFEFLGDALLNFSVALLIHDQRPDLDEGSMSKLRSLIINTDALAAWANEIDLILDMGHRQSLGDRAKADGMEALLAAIYFDAQAIDAQGLQTIDRLIQHRFGKIIQTAGPADWQAMDAKTTLQETVALRNQVPLYQLESKSGPDHAPEFQVSVQVGELTVTAKSTTLKKAEAEAAKKMLLLIKRL